MVARGWSQAQIQAYVLADNKLALNAGWDEALLGVELADLQGMGFDLATIGFNDKELKDLMGGGARGGLTDPDDTLEVALAAMARSGNSAGIGWSAANAPRRRWSRRSWATSHPPSW